jgi:hypothetical protein
MANFLIDLTWQRHTLGYELLPAVEGQPEEPFLSRSGVGQSQRIVPKGLEGMFYKPMENSGLFVRFAGVRCAEDLLDFTNKFGLLTAEGYRLYDDVPDVLGHSANFRNWLLRKEDTQSRLSTIAGEDGIFLARSEIYIVRDKTGAPRLQYRATTLLYALWIQLINALTGEREFRDCLHCGRPFEVGPGERRLDAKFCTDEHRIRFNRRKANPFGVTTQRGVMVK